MLENIIGTKSKVRVLQELTANPERDYSVEDLTRITGMSYGTIHPSVRELADSRIVLVKKAGGSKIYRINLSHVLYNELAALFERQKNAFREIADEFAEKLDKTGIDNIILFGSVARKETANIGDIDILIIYSGMYLAGKSHELEEEILDKYDVVISPLFLSKSEVLVRINEYDNFMLNVLDEGKILYGESKWLVK